MVMNRQLRDCLIMDGVTQCKNIIDNKVQDLTNMLPDGKFFFKGCLEGFELSRKLICLEQFEEFIITLKNTAENGKVENTNYDQYITNMGKRCALEFIYNALSSSK